MQHASSSARGAGRADRAGANTQTERTLLFKVCISKVHLRREKEAAHAPATLRVAHAAKACDGRDLSVYAVGRPDGGPRGLAHHVRPPRRVPGCLAHLLSEGEGLAPRRRGLSRARGAGRADRAAVHGRRGHSLERTVFRKCTFGAIMLDIYFKPTGRILYNYSTI